MTPLEILNLSPGCTLEEVKKQYRALSLRYHPDKNPGNEKAAEIFRLINESYTALRNNPDLLRKKRPAYSGYISVEIPIDISDIYLQKTKVLNITRKRICSICEGTGSSLGVRGVCDLCGGNKKIKNRVSNLIGLSDTCPSCNGSGLKNAPLCSCCGGSGKVNDSIITKFKVNEDQFRNRLVVLRGLGDEYERGFSGDIHIRLKEIVDSNIVLYGDTYGIKYKVTPAQYALGSRVCINILGKNIYFNVPQEHNEIVLEDKRKDGLVRKITVGIEIVSTNLTPAIRALYEEILSLEGSTQDRSALSEDVTPLIEGN